MKSNSSRLASVLGLLLMINFLTLAYASHFDLRNVGAFNFDISTMLTPFGIFRNLLWTQDHYLAPYYHSLTRRAGVLEQPGLLGLLICNTLLISVALVGLKKFLSKKSLSSAERR